MIVSYSRNFIFVKTKKTAGSTVEAVPAAACAEGDVITHEDGYRHPGSDLALDGKAQRQRHLAKIVRGGERRPNRKLAGKLYNHMGAAEAYDRLDPAFRTGTFQLTAVRHPYEKAVSQAFYRAFREGGGDISGYLEREACRMDFEILGYEP